MSALRSKVGLLVESGYGVSAWEFPIWFVLEESDQIVKRRDAEMASEAVMMHMTLSAIPSMAVKAQSTKEAVKAFNKQISKMLEV